MASESPQMLEALNSELRRSILRLFGEGREDVGALQVSSSLERPIGLVSYHLSFLVRAGALECAGRAGARAAAARRYGLAPAGRQAWVRGVLDASRESDGA